MVVFRRRCLSLVTFTVLCVAAAVPRGAAAVGLLGVLATAGCGGDGTMAPGATPLLRASQGGSARLTVTACAYGLGGTEMLAETLRQLYERAPVLVADRGAVAMSLNLCPTPPDPAVVRALREVRR